MLKNVTKLEMAVEERVHQYICEQQCTLEEVFNVLSSMRSYVLAMINEHNKQEEEKQKQSVETDVN